MKYMLFTVEFFRIILGYLYKTKQKMKTVILSGESDSDIRLLVELANKLGIKTQILSEEDAEDLAMAYAIEKGKTGEYVDTQNFIQNLRQ
jgi:ribosomal protein L18